MDYRDAEILRRFEIDTFRRMAAIERQLRRERIEADPYEWARWTAAALRDTD